jgi:hypothetical protein
MLLCFLFDSIITVLAGFYKRERSCGLLLITRSGIVKREEAPKFRPVFCGNSE